MNLSELYGEHWGKMTLVDTKVEVLFSQLSQQRPRGCLPEYNRKLVVQIADLDNEMKKVEDSYFQLVKGGKYEH